jgi:nicotinate-nucleotide pyrophosphorylase
MFVIQSPVVSSQSSAYLCSGELKTYVTQAGQVEATSLLLLHCLQVQWTNKDGAEVEAGTVFGTVTGPASSILVAERIALNFMQARDQQHAGCQCDSTY